MAAPRRQLTWDGDGTAAQVQLWLGMAIGVRAADAMWTTGIPTGP